MLGANLMSISPNSPVGWAKQTHTWLWQLVFSPETFQRWDYYAFGFNLSALRHHIDSLPSGWPNFAIQTPLFAHIFSITKICFCYFHCEIFFALKNMLILKCFHLFLAFTEFNPVALCSDLGVKFASCCTVDDLTCHPLTSQTWENQKLHKFFPNMFFTKQNVKHPPNFLKIDASPSHPSIWGTVFLELPPSESHHCNPRKMKPVGQ